MPGIELRAVLALATRGVVREAERVLIGRALEASGGTRTKAAELLGMSVRTLRNKLNGPEKGEEDDGTKGVVRCAVQSSSFDLRSSPFVLQSSLFALQSSLLAKPPTRVQRGWAVVFCGRRERAVQ